MAKKRKPHVAKVPRNNSPTLGAFQTNRGTGERPQYADRANLPTVRSLKCVGGIRPSCRWTKKADNKARRAGYPSAAAMADALTKVFARSAARRSLAAA